MTVSRLDNPTAHPGCFEPVNPARVGFQDGKCGWKIYDDAMSVAAALDFLRYLVCNKLYPYRLAFQFELVHLDQGRIEDIRQHALHVIALTLNHSQEFLAFILAPIHLVQKQGRREPQYGG
jgi:hypothetical protein